MCDVFNQIGSLVLALGPIPIWHMETAFFEGDPKRRFFLNLKIVILVFTISDQKTGIFWTELIFFVNFQVCIAVLQNKVLLTLL